MRLSLKLGVLCAAAALLPLFIASLILVLQVSSSARAEALDRLQGNARTAGGFYEKRLVELRAAASQLADTIASRALISDASDKSGGAAALARLQDLLPRAQNDYFLDFVIVTDNQGRVIARHNDRPAPGETLLGAEDKNPLLDKALGSNAPVASCAVERGERYQRLWLDRIAKVKLADGSTVDEALAVEAAAPIISGGRPVGAVLIGQMLNTYWRPRSGASAVQTPLVAEVRQAISRTADEDSGALVSNNIGVIASSIPPAAGNNEPAALGALHDPSRLEETLTDGTRSYVVAWQPLKTLDGISIGSIGFGRPLAELTAAGESVRATMLVIGSIATVLAAAAGFLFGRLLGARLDDLREAASRWTVGELSAPASDNDALSTNGVKGFLKRDEIAVLAGQMEEMRVSFRHAIERIRKR